MNPTPANEKSLGVHVSELRQLVITYIRQEILGPLRGAGRYLKKGMVGGLIGVVAGIVAAVGLLRAAQSIDVADVPRGAWSWAVYLIAGLACLLVGGLVFYIGIRSRRQQA